MTIIDSVARLIPGALNNQNSALKDSFSYSLLDHPHYTNPRKYRKRSVPEILLKGTKVDGVYDKDPHKHIDAKKYNELSYNKVIRDDLRVMDMTAITLCHENNIPIKVFNIKSSGDLIDIISGSNIGTTIGK